MESWQKNVVVLWAAVFIAAAAWTMVMPFMPVFLSDDLGVGAGVTVWAGLLGAVNSGFSALTAPIWGALGDRWGRKAMMIRAGVFLGSAYVLMAFVRNPYELLGVRVMIGALTGFIPTATALVATTTPERHMGRALSVVATGNQAGSILGPMLGGFLADLIGIRNTMALGGVAGSRRRCWCWRRSGSSSSVRRTSRCTSSATCGRCCGAAAPALLATTVLMMASQAAMEPILIPYIRELLGSGSPNWMAGVIYSVPGIAFVLAAPSWAKLGERWGYVTTVTLGLAGGALLTLPQAIVRSGMAMGLFPAGGGSLPGGRHAGPVRTHRSHGASGAAGEARAEPVGVQRRRMLGPLLGGVMGDRGESAGSSRPRRSCCCSPRPGAGPSCGRASGSAASRS